MECLQTRNVGAFSNEESDPFVVGGGYQID